MRFGKRQTLLQSVLISLLIGSIFFVVHFPPTWAADSTDFNLNQERGGTIEYSGTSANYDVKAEIGHPGVGESTSTNYIYDHGTQWFSTTGSVQLTIRWAVPELRVGSSETNDDSVFYLTIRSASDSDDSILRTMSYLATTSVDGTYATSIVMDVLSGDYDIGIKTNQHLTKLIQDIAVSDATTTVLNFTNTSNTSTKGSQTLLSGDISGAGDAPTTLGDDVVNSVDLSILIPKLDVDDSTGNAERSNLNQDVVINSVDLSMLLKNLDLNGEQ